MKTSKLSPTAIRNRVAHAWGLMTPRRPCPFCGSERLENLDDFSGAVHCIDCGARGPCRRPDLSESWWPAEHDNVEAWDTRLSRKWRP